MASVTSLLKDVQGDALKQAQNRAKRDEERFKREDAARKRAERISAVKTRQNALKNDMGTGLLTALFGRTIGDFASNALKAQEKTRSDIAEMESAAYEDRIETAADRKAEAVEAAELAREDAIAKAASDYGATAEESAKALGAAIDTAKVNNAILSATEAAKETLDAAKAARDKVESEITPEETRKGTAPATGHASGVIMGSGAPAKAGTPKILSPEGKDAIAEANAEKALKEKASRNLEADARVSAASDAFAKAQRAEGAAPSRYAGAALEGERAMADVAKATAAATGAINAALVAETMAKVAAENAEAKAKTAAREEKASGELVSEGDRKSISATNMLAEAVAPPALAVLGKVAERFQGLFPVIEQSGDAIIELGTALPAALFTVGGQTIAGIQSAISGLIDSFPWTTRDVYKRYEESDKAVVAATGMTRAGKYREAQEYNLTRYKRMSTDAPDRKASAGGLMYATRGPVTANASPQFTTIDTHGATSGITHTAQDVLETRVRPVTPVPPPPQQERPLGVIPVGPSNASVDSWRN